jgi:cell wall-associated NlpC family hydrolase
MSVGAVGLQQIQQTLGDLATPSSSDSASASGSSAQQESFILALAQATNDVSTMNGLSGLDGDALFNQETGSGDLASSDSSSPSSFTSELAALVAGQSPTSTTATASTALTTTLPSSEPGVPTGAQVVSEAQQYVGTPYVWGGTTPTGFDCSGFTQYVYGQLGMQLPRTSEEQATAGTAVASLADAQPGDLVFFAGSDGTASAPGHVGIYVGNGDMIDAPYTGTTVQVQPVADAGPVVAIRQVLPSASISSVVMGNVTVPAQYVGTVEQAASANGIPASLLAGLLQQESGFNPNAVSSAGAEGIAQFMPATAAGLGVDPYDPTSAINGAAQMLGSYTRQFGSYADALAAYNAGSSAVERYGGIPPYAETEAYVPAVLSLAGLSDGEESAS